MYPIIYGKSPFEIPTPLEAIEDMQIVEITVSKLGVLDTCGGCVFENSILCMYTPDCEYIIYKAQCDD